MSEINSPSDQPTSSAKLTLDNYKKGFLIDDELMAGISESQNAGNFMAYVVRHTTGEVLGSQEFSNLFEAIRAINQVERNWEFQTISKCGGGNCGNGKCAGGGCGKKKEASAETNTSDSGCC